MNVKIVLWTISFLLTLIFFAALAYHLVMLHQAYDPDETQLTDTESAKKYLEAHFKATSKIRGIPLYVPTGVFISSINWIDVNAFNISGYIWQKYPHAYSDFVPEGFILPEAVELEKQVAYRKKTATGVTVGWHFEGKINQHFDYTKYPLDHKTVKIRLWSHNFSQNIVLIPDFGSYDSTLSTDKFGLDPEIVLGGYDILETFFRYRHTDYDTNFGFSKGAIQKNFPELYFNIVLKRHPDDALIIHVLPLIVVIILCFLTLLSSTLVEQRRRIYNFNYMQILTLCAALFFVLLLAHIHLREVFAGVGIVYLEYTYLITYLCIIYVTINAYLVVRARISSEFAYRIIEYKDDLVPKVVFLPLFSGLALAVSFHLF